MKLKTTFQKLVSFIFKMFTLKKYLLELLGNIKKNKQE